MPTVGWVKLNQLMTSYDPCPFLREQRGNNTSIPEQRWKYVKQKQGHR